MHWLAEWVEDYWPIVACFAVFGLLMVLYAAAFKVRR